MLKISAATTVKLLPGLMTRAATDQSLTGRWRQQVELVLGG